MDSPGVTVLGGDELDAWRDGLRGRLVDERVRAGYAPADASARVDGFLRVADPLADDSVVARVGADGPVLWVRRRPTGVAQLASYDGGGGDAATAREALATLAGLLPGAVHVDVGVLAGNEGLRALVDASPGARLVATQMLADLADERLAERAPGLELRPMSEEQYASYVSQAVEAYARSRFDSGSEPTWDTALAESERSYAELLPAGLASPGEHLWHGYAAAGATDVGWLWLHVEGEGSFVYDVEVHEALRGHGHGSALLRAGATRARDLGATRIGLNVFGHNPDARRLYERLGFGVLEEYWSLPLHPSPS